MINFIAGTYCLFFYRRKIRKKPCDILFLHSSQKDIAATKSLSMALKRHNFHVLHEVIPLPKAILLNRLLAKTTRYAPLPFCVYEYYASYIVKKHEPRILITLDLFPFASFLKNEMEKMGGKSVQLAHGVIGQNELFTIYDFHYYFVFGQSSVDAAFQQRTRYGSTKLVKTGSFFIDEEFHLSPGRKGKKLLFFSSWLQKNVRDIILANFNLLAKWAKLQGEYELAVKHHPLEDESIIRSIFRDVPNVKFLPKEVRMKEALADISIVLTGWSCASIEAAILNRPAVIINNSDFPDFLELEKYYTPRACTVEEIQARIEETFKRYDEFIESAKRLVRRHLERTTDSIPYIVKCLKSIYDGKEDFEYINIKGTKDYFYK